MITQLHSLNKEQNKEARISVVHVDVSSTFLKLQMAFPSRSTVPSNRRKLRQTGRCSETFDSLKVDELRQESTARGVSDTTMKKDALNGILESTLKGIVRVPALLLPNPTQSLSILNLSRYELLASEPLHDLKGHIINLL